ncbi:putative MFS family arabinose efflux permease [Halomonas organivorans]|uniref:Putative MFS family arabinose efflux permease n=2 Tax=Halomonas organivorans TaxID=257772 RepID=A0A7W5G4Z1_9GAMM|nr:putative MFS family arabinose efflux permease [Halomonas organivorans]
MRITDAMLPALSITFHKPIADVAQNITVFTLAYGLMQLVYGPLSDRHGALWVIGLACLACALGTFGTALAQSLPILFLFRGLSGATAAAIIPLSMAWVGSHVPYERRQVTLMHMLSGTVLGLSIGQLAGGLLADSFGWQTAFYLLTGLFLFAGTLLLNALKRHPELAPRGTGERVNFLERIASILAIPRARQILIFVCLEGIAVFGALAFTATHLHDGLDVSLSLAGGTVALFGIGGLTFAGLAHRMVTRLGETGLATGGGLLMGFGFICLALAPWIGLAMFAAFATGLGFYMMHSTLQTNATQMAPSARGTAMALFAGCLFLGQSLGIALGGLLLPWSGSTGVLVAAGLWLFMLGLILARQLR